MAARCGGQGEAVTAENVGNVLELDVCVCGGAPHIVEAKMPLNQSLKLVHFPLNTIFKR